MQQQIDLLKFSNILYIIVFLRQLDLFMIVDWTSICIITVLLVLLILVLWSGVPVSLISSAYLPHLIGLSTSSSTMQFSIFFMSLYLLTRTLSTKLAKTVPIKMTNKILIPKNGHDANCTSAHPALSSEPLCLCTFSSTSICFVEFNTASV